MPGPYTPKILGVLNLSPESMVEESIAIGREAIRERAATLARTGADWLDLGGRSRYGMMHRRSS